MENQTIECINQIDNIILESEINVLFSLLYSYDKCDMIMENGGYSEIAEVAIFNESAKVDASVKRQSGFMKLVNKVKELVMKLVSNILKFFGFFKTSKKIDKAVEKSENSRRTIIEKGNNILKKKQKWEDKHSVFAGLIGIGVTNAIILGKRKIPGSINKARMQKCYDKALESLDNDFERECIKRTIKIVRKTNSMGVGFVDIMYYLPFNPTNDEVERIAKIFKAFYNPGTFTEKYVNSQEFKHIAENEDAANNFLKSPKYKEFITDFVKTVDNISDLGNHYTNMQSKEYKTVDDYDEGAIKILNMLDKAAYGLQSAIKSLEIISKAVNICTLPDKNKYESDITLSSNVITRLVTEMKPFSELLPYLKTIQSCYTRFVVAFNAEVDIVWKNTHQT